ncbi:6-phospho 3-hexuloisomerase [Lentibacillus kapialis]|uniref:6-phospho 3-hexuloisomerase n=1 Tax=Lentibacillus kapialis TaxID=340214 RepID=A0A917V118_9BACI|nr:6-phospho-3-hexuloisomerase [Lentibacillus kapialis]GGK06374.1 6-phospho 3-hexuloisomerase [Lentibacillus kapialis]
MKQTIKSITNEVTEVLEKVDNDELELLARQIAQSRRVFIAGNGRSGLAGKMFAMRLMHIGYTVYVVGETITPSIKEDDLLIVISGSGGTQTLVYYVNKAKEAHSSVGSITTNMDSPIGQSCDFVVKVPAVTKKTKGHRNTIQPLGSQFDQSVHVLLDGIVVFLIEHYAQSAGDIFNKKHANLE